MSTHQIPRDYKGENRILYIFSTKALIYTVVGILIGLIFYFIFNAIGLQIVGLFIDVIFGVIGFAIGTFKMPETKRFEITQKTGGENIDDIIIRWFKFKKNKDKIYILKEEETKDE